LISKDTLLSNDLFGTLKPNDWPITLADLPSGSALVGGSIRDGLLKKSSQKPDLDFVIPSNAINFTRNLAKKINASFIKLDQKRDIARLVVNGWTLDFASQIGENLKEDLFRRDFRINAIALKLEKNPQIYDPTGGIDDLKEGKIVAISEKNLTDDPLRILRGFRLMCELNFEIDRKTKSYLKNNVNKLSNVAPERIKMEILKIVNSQWNASAWNTYLELQLLQNWNLGNCPLITLNKREFFPKELNDGLPFAKLITLLSDEGLSRLTFSKNQVKRCKKIRFWASKIYKVGLDNLSEDERFQLHVELGDDLPSLMIFLKDEYQSVWLRRWRDLSDPLFHPSTPLDGKLLQRALKLPPGPFLGRLMHHLAQEKAYGRICTNQEALEVARKWTLENYPFL
tara:strand:+ start:1197 stop:2390 length:1194 start_codon:yes stop_codon:yes gene_type:complete